MIWIKRGLMGLAAAGVIAIPTQSPTTKEAAEPSRGSAAIAPVRATQPAFGYQSSSKEFYLTAEQTAWIRPGLKLKLNSLTIGADRKPVVDISFTDDLDQPLDRAGKVTPGAISLSFVLAWYDGAARQYTSYTVRTVTTPASSPRPGVTTVQAASDANGTPTDVELGRMKYTFRTVLPETFDKTKTHTLGIYSTRNLTAIIGKNYYANLLHDFRPDNGTVAEKWEPATLEKSCNRCHDPLSAHGGSRRELKLCALCHSPQTIDPDTGNTVDFKVMVHKIHMGVDLPSVKAGTPYLIYGNAQRVFDFGKVLFPQDQRNCVTCHNPEAAEKEVWYARPNREACGSCHDNVNWTTGAGHAAGPQTTDANCASCHAPQGDREYDASIKGAHTIEVKSTQLKGLKAEVVSVEQTGPGQKPVVTFKLSDSTGALDPKPFGSNVNLLLGGPTTDYAIDPFRENASGCTFNGTVCVYTFRNAIPADATGTWAVSIEARRTVTLNAGTPKQRNVTEGADNPIKYIAVTGGQPAPRRMLVSQQKCNDCHDRLALHGGQRLTIEECIVCHNPNASDKARRPADKLPAESISMARMIHRIHTGEELTQDLTIYGFFIPPNPPNPINFNEVLYPGDRRNCETCHEPGTYGVPPKAVLPVLTPRDFYTPQQPAAASCLGCHDTRDAAAHAFVNTAPFGESCAACHGANAEFSVAKVHAR